MRTQQCLTYGKNLNAFTSKLLAVNASLISSSVTVALHDVTLEWMEKNENEKKFYFYDNILLRRFVTFI